MWHKRENAALLRAELDRQRKRQLLPPAFDRLPGPVLMIFAEFLEAVAESCRAAAMRKTMDSHKPIPEPTLWELRARACHSITQDVRRGIDPRKSAARHAPETVEPGDMLDRWRSEWKGGRSQARDALINELAATRTNAQIAAIFGVHANTVSRWLRDLKPGSTRPEKAANHSHRSAPIDRHDSPDP